eukprot:14901726-Alexandrium_andersonii.AAC.1
MVACLWLRSFGCARELGVKGCQGPIWCVGAQRIPWGSGRLSGLVGEPGLARGNWFRGGAGLRISWAIREPRGLLARRSDLSCGGCGCLLGS